MTNYASAVGSFITRFRIDHGLTLDSIASTARKFGATWNTASVRSLASGKMSPTLPNLLILALTLGELSGKPVRLMDLFGDTTEFDLPVTSSGPAPRAWLQDVLSGKPVALNNEASATSSPAPPVGSSSRGKDAKLSLASQLIKERDLANAIGVELSTEERKARNDLIFEALLDERQQPEERSPLRSLRQSTLAEERASKKLGIPVIRLQRIAFELWGHSLELESAARAGVGSSPQARGNYTRQLIAEISQYLDKADTPS